MIATYTYKHMMYTV